MFKTRIPLTQRGPSSHTIDGVQVCAQPRVGEDFEQPVVSSKWWTAALWAFREEDFCQCMYPHPLALKPTPSGMGLCYPTRLAISEDQRMYSFPYEEDLLVGLAGMKGADLAVQAYSDWTATLRWQHGDQRLRATTGHGVPYVYFDCEGTDARAELRCAEEPEVWHDEGAVLALTVRGRDYALFGPTGSRWHRVGRSPVWRNDLVGRGYWSVAVLPGRRPDILADFQRHAHAVVTQTRATWRYDVESATVVTDFHFTTMAREGDEHVPLVALYPHQWKYSDASMTNHRYGSPRGLMKVARTRYFTTRLRVPGMLPALPSVEGPHRAQLARFIEDAFEEREAALWPQPPESKAVDDAYWSGKALGRLVQLAQLAEATGQHAARKRFLGLVRSKLSQFFEGDDKACFYYDETWRSLIFYPAASHGLDTALNDHQYAYGYFIRAAVALLQDDPSWWARGDNAAMVRAMVRDVANPDRTDLRFPFMRHFDVYAGHSWGSGAAPDDAGLNAEPSSEAIHFAQAVLLLGLTLGDAGGPDGEGATLRDLGAYLYAHEVVAAEQYWFNQDGDVFPYRYPWPVAGIVWGSGARYGTWWADGPEEVHGINLVPMQAGSLYLAREPAKAARRHENMLELAGGAARIWQDVHRMHEALLAPQKALAAYRSEAPPTAEWGNSKAMLLHWLESLARLGTPCAGISANTPCHQVFERDGQRCYVASNLGERALQVRFSDGTVLDVPSRSMVVHEPAAIARVDAVAARSAAARVVLQVDRLAKAYRPGAVQAVRDVSLRVHAGQCLGLLGTNGAGKSTTIACILGLYPPTAGRVLIAGHDVHRHPKAARRHLGVCLQDETLDTELCVLDQLLGHAAYFRIPRAVALPRALALLECFGLAERAQASVDRLSGGMRRVLQVARALMSDPALLVLDEPSAGLDPEVRRHLWDELKRRQQAGLAILLTTHYMEEAQYLCDDIALLGGGRVLDQGSVDELLERHAPGATLEQVYLRVAGGRLLRTQSAQMEALHVDA